MEVNYIKKYSESLGRDMEYKTYGDSGHGIIVFPSQNGRFYDYEDFGMVSILSEYIDEGLIRLVCVDSIDSETWSDRDGDEHRRITRHEQWFRYVTDELIPDVRLYDGETFMATGCSMGGYHAGNFFFRRPDLFDTLLALSGLYHADYFFPGYTDPLVYDNSPYDCLANMPDDHFYLDIYRQRRIVMCVGQGRWEDGMLESTGQMDEVMQEKNVPAWVDYWGHDVDHDWPWWRRQIAYFIPIILEDEISPSESAV